MKPLWGYGSLKRSGVSVRPLLQKSQPERYRTGEFWRESGRGSKSFQLWRDGDSESGTPLDKLRAENKKRKRSYGKRKTKSQSGGVLQRRNPVGNKWRVMAGEHRHLPTNLGCLG